MFNLRNEKFCFYFSDFILLSLYIWYLQIFLFIFPAVWTFLKDLKVNNHQIVGILSQTGKKNVKTFIYIHSRLPEKVSASSIFWNRLKLNTSIVGLVAEFIGCSVLWFIASLIVKLCVHFLSVCLKVQKWTQTNTRVNLHNQTTIKLFWQHWFLSNCQALTPDTQGQQCFYSSE